MQDLFKFEISSVTELVLGGNANYPVKRLQWKTVTGIAAHVLTTIQYPHCCMYNKLSNASIRLHNYIMYKFHHN